jgi:hypothetical protein
VRATSSFQAAAGEDLAGADRMTKLRAAVKCGGDLNHVNQAIQHYVDVKSTVWAVLGVDSLQQCLFLEQTWRCG